MSKSISKEDIEVKVQYNDLRWDTFCINEKIKETTEAIKYELAMLVSRDLEAIFICFVTK